MAEMLPFVILPLKAERGPAASEAAVAAKSSRRDIDMMETIIALIAPKLIAPKMIAPNRCPGGTGGDWWSF